MPLTDKLRAKTTEPVDRGDPIVFADLAGNVDGDLDNGSLSVDLDAPLGDTTPVADDDAANDPFAERPRTVDRARPDTGDDSIEPRDNFLTSQDGIDLVDDLDAPVGDAPRRRSEATQDDLSIDEDLRSIPNKDLARRIMAEREESASLRGHVDATRVRDFETRKVQVGTRIAQIDNRLTAIETEMEAALEAGESKTVTKLNRELASLAAERQTAADAKNYLDRQPAPKPTTRADPDVSLVGKPVNQLAARYADRNPWMKDTRFSGQHQALKSIDEAIFAEGKDPNTPGYYIEMDRRLRAIYPNLPGTPLRGGAGHGQPRGRQTVNGSTDDAPPRNGGNGTGGRIPITAEDRGNMERFGLDPRKKADIVAYAREKRSLSRAEQARARR